MPILDTGDIYRYVQLVKDINLIMMCILQNLM